LRACCGNGVSTAVGSINVTATDAPSTPSTSTRSESVKPLTACLLAE
jgi:hypothetical protein